MHPTAAAATQATLAACTYLAVDTAGSITSVK
eukprot:CAMPEP_0172663164 /NCGR_PEP_ID=MMETSP1074-20121228/5741_1 /TAXON_ID=2916 /ORGANISM="Ceratium fusus, Strain PA161109" /LENGTH=31 /DNA_ID= /DNA_START= /DNA_END= /DNA_ORIENTATION=